MRFRLTGGQALAWVIAAFVLVYGGDVGRGFIKDDFSWILHSPMRASGGMSSAFTETPMGFYRPLVALSFGLNERLFGLAPAPYAWTNVALAAATALLVAATAAGLGFGRLGGAFAAGLWLFNLHGINMALLWTSGRTSLIGALGATTAAFAFVHRRYGVAGVFTVAALLGKEEPLLLPVVFAVWAWIDAGGEGGIGMPVDWRGRAAAAIRASWPSFLGMVVYFLLRARTDAFTPATAPDVYQLHPGAIAANALQYLDRSLTFTAAVLGLGWLAFSRRRVAIDAHERQTMAKGFVWVVLGFALTIMIESRSSLYAVYPSIGSAIAGVAVGRAIWRTIPLQRRNAALAAALVLPLACWPVYHARNQRLKDEGTLSSRLLARIQDEIDARPSIARIVVLDDPDARPSASSALGEKLGDAVRLATGRDVPSAIIPGAPAAFPPDVHEAGTLVLVVDHGAVTVP